MAAIDPAVASLPPCDLVMKGGITSGVVYPRLIARLADKYRFQCVGGTSAGAIAAAGCAAAEYGRQRGGKPNAFQDLAGLPDTLGEPVGSPRASTLFHLFRPATGLRHHFAVLVGALNKRDKLAALVGVLRALLVRFWPVALLSLVVAGLIGVPILRSVLPLTLPAATLWMLAIIAIWAAWMRIAVWLSASWPGTFSRWRSAALWLVAGVATTAIALRLAGAPAGWPLVGGVLALVLALLLCLALALILAVLRFGLTLLAGLHGNKWGLCSGHEATDGREPAPPPALTDWLTGYFNDLAGMDSKGRPLTFGDLWGERPDPIVAAAPDTPPRERLLDLQVMTTAVSQRMCYAIPLRDNADRFFYDRSEWADLFPDPVMKWLDAVSAVEDAGRDPVVADHGGVPLRRFPRGRYLPVVVAVRMSLSFPVLLSAMPLYAIDYSMSEAGKPPPLATRVWFSDGGIASNMPLHFFDAPLPGRPTFAINLKGEHPLKRFKIDPKKKACEQLGRVYLPDNNNAGRSQHWTPPSNDKMAGLFDFLGGIVDTMQNWRDGLQFPYPGYRDRIVQISQLKDEGGLNLDMPKKNIDALSDAGECAADKIVQRFHPSGADTGGGWENHEEIRLRTFLALVEELATHPRVQDAHWDAVAARVKQRGQYEDEQCQLALEMLKQLRALGATVNTSATSLRRRPAAPRPMAQMRTAPRI